MWREARGKGLEPFRVSWDTSHVSRQLTWDLNSTTVYDMLRRSKVFFSFPIIVAFPMTTPHDTDDPMGDDDHTRNSHHSHEIDPRG
jgi:hypothetical protein